MKLLPLFLFIACAFFRSQSLSAADSVAPSPASALLALSSGDVSSTALFMTTKGDSPVMTNLQIVFSKEKQSELARIAGENPGKKIKIEVSGTAVAEMEILPATIGHPLSVHFDSAEDAFSVAKALIPNLAQTVAPLEVKDSKEALVFALVPKDVSKTVVLMSKSELPKLEVTFPKDKQEELARIAAESASGGKAVKTMLDGKVVAEREPYPAPSAEHPLHIGHSLKVTYSVPDEAFSMAKALMKHTKE